MSNIINSPEIIGYISGVNYIELTPAEITALINDPGTVEGVHWSDENGNTQMLQDGNVETYSMLSDLEDFLTASEIQDLVDAAERSYAEKLATQLTGKTIDGVTYTLTDISTKTTTEIAAFVDSVLEAINVYLASTNTLAQDAVDFNDTVPTLISTAVSDLETALKDGVATDGNTLAKLRALISSLDTAVNTNITDIGANAGDISTLQSQVSSINTLLQSDDINLDEIQEIIDFIKANKDTLDNLTIAGVAGLQAYLDGIDSAVSSISDSLGDYVKFASSTEQRIASDMKIAKNTYTQVVTAEGGIFAVSGGYLYAPEGGVSGVSVGDLVEIRNGSGVVATRIVSAVYADEVDFTEYLDIPNETGIDFFAYVITDAGADLTVTGNLLAKTGQMTETEDKLFMSQAEKDALTLATSSIGDLIGDVNAAENRLDDIETLNTTQAADIATKVAQTAYDTKITELEAALATKLESADVDNIVREYTVTGAGTQVGNFYNYTVPVGVAGYRVSGLSAEINGSAFMTSVTYNVDRTEFTLAMPFALGSSEVTFAATLKAVA